MQLKPVVLVCGASARQVVSIATEAHFVCDAVDLFADYDTQRLARKSVKVDRLDNLRMAVDSFDYDYCLPAGGMENYPDVFASICSPNLPFRDYESLLRCRDPFLLYKLVRNNVELKKLGVSFPFTTLTRPSFPSRRKWLIKQTNKSGGLGVQSLRANGLPNLESQVYQHRKVGNVVSGLFIGDGSQAFMVGTSHQLHGRKELGAREYLYCGSIAPFLTGIKDIQAMSASADACAREFGLRGVFGIDFVIDRNTIWMLEINPRFTASAEICQKLLGYNIVEEHVAAISTSEFSAKERFGRVPALTSQDFHGKAIVYHRLPNDLTVSNDFHNKLRDWSTRKISPSKIVSDVCDLPMPMTKISPGSPILTVLATAQQKSAVEAKLLQLADEIYRIVES